MNIPLVSVIITTYKRSEYLLRAINSVFCQTYKNYEVIVVDDNGETDYRITTKIKLANLIEEKKVRYIEHAENRGISAARNTGIINSKGDYIAFLDDDDEFYPNKLELQIQAFQELGSTVGLVYGAFLKIEVEQNEEEIIPPKYSGDLSKVLGLNYIGPPSMVMCTKVAVDKVGGFDENLRYKEDTDFYLRLSQSFKISYVNQVLIKYYLHSSSASKNYSSILQNTIKFLDKNKTVLVSPKKRWSENQERLGEFLVLNNKKAEARKAFMKAYLNRPTRITILAKAVLSYFQKTYDI